MFIKHLLSTYYVQGPRFGIQAPKLPFLKCSRLFGESDGKRIDHTVLQATVEICTTYPSLAQEETTFSSWISPKKVKSCRNNLTEKVKADEG